MRKETEKAVVMALRSDPDFTPEMVSRFVAGGIEFAGRCAKPTVGDRILSRSQVAADLGVSPSSVDNFAKRGWICRVYFPGGKRARGFTESSVLGMKHDKLAELPRFGL